MLGLVCLLLLPLVAFGGRSPTIAITFAVLSVGYAAIASPRLMMPLDRSLCLLAAAVVIQLVPLPLVIANLLSPHGAALRTSLSLLPSGSTWQPLSINPQATAEAALELIGAFALFVAAREQLASGGFRRLSRAIAMIGFGVAFLGIAQAATGGRSIYWLFPTEVEGPLPFGPFVNRNHFATWIIMAMPICLGYMAARMPPRQPDSEQPTAPLDARAAWMIGALVTMLLALLLSLSRSGALGLAVAAIGTLFLTRHAMDGWYFRRLGATVALVTLLAVSWADLPAIHERLAGVRGGLVNRLVIWNETLPVVRDFWLTGVGAGAYETAMRVYQRSDRKTYFNQAHNHYLQVAAEGGLLLTVPLVIALVTFVRTARNRLQRDRTPMWRIRVGAACGLAAVALQSVWETGLGMTANSAMAALLGGILVCERRPLSKPAKRARRKTARVEERQSEAVGDSVPGADEVGVGEDVLAEESETKSEPS